MWFLGLAGDLKKAMKDGKPIIIEVCMGIYLVAGSLNILFNILAVLRPISQYLISLFLKTLTTSGQTFPC